MIIKNNFNSSSLSNGYKNNFNKGKYMDEVYHAKQNNNLDGLGSKL